MEIGTEMVPLRDLFVSEACMNATILELRKWSNHLAFHFPKNVRRVFE